MSLGNLGESPLTSLLTSDMPSEFPEDITLMLLRLKTDFPSELFQLPMDAEKWISEPYSSTGRIYLLSVLKKHGADTEHYIQLGKKASAAELQQMGLFLDQPRYVLWVFAYFINPVWIRRLALTAFLLSIVALIIACLSTSPNVSRHAFHWAIATVPLCWLTAYILVPLWSGTIVRGLIALQNPLFSFFRLDPHKTYKYFALFYEVVAQAALFISIVQCPLVALGLVNLD